MARSAPFQVRPLQPTLVKPFHRPGWGGAVHFGLGRELPEALTANGLARSTSPFSEKVPLKGVKWLEPKLMAQVSYAEIMQGGRLRAGVFRGFAGS